MQSASASECFDHINAYFGGKRTGHLLLVNTENYNIYQEILVRLQADTSKNAYVLLNMLRQMVCRMSML